MSNDICKVTLKEAFEYAFNHRNNHEPWEHTCERARNYYEFLIGKGRFWTFQADLPNEGVNPTNE